jgi:hypothetical protein
MRSRNGPRAILAALGLVTALAAPVAAQEEATAIPYLDASGTQLGTMTVRDFADPFTEFDPNSKPAEGQRYALLTMTFEAAEDQAFPTDPRSVQLIDSNGWLYYPAWVPRLPDAKVPELQSQTLAPFDRISGVIGYVLPADAQIVGILYRGDGSRLQPVSVLGDAGAVPVGEARPITDGTGATQLGTLTIREVSDPFTGNDPGAPPAEGQRFVMLTAAFEAAADQAMYAAPGNVYLVGSDGMVYWPTRVWRPAGQLLQDLEQQPLSPTDRVSGVIGYALPAGAVVDSIIYSPENNRFVTIADL